MSAIREGPRDRLCQWCWENVFDEETFSSMLEAPGMFPWHRHEGECERTDSIETGMTTYCLCNTEKKTRRFRRPLKSIQEAVKVEGCVFCPLLETAATQAESSAASSLNFSPVLNFKQQRSPWDMEHGAASDLWDSHIEPPLVFEISFVFPSRWCSINFPVPPNRYTFWPPREKCHFRLYPDEQSLAPVLESALSLTPAGMTIDDRRTTRDEIEPTHVHCSSSPARALEEEARDLRAKIQECILHHERCKTFATKFRPSRLLRLSGHHAFPAFRLEELPGSASEQAIDYVCLSYCWGGDQPGKLMTERLSTYREGIPTSTFSKSILDAAAMTLALGFQYLWVDAYCIIQNSEEDKSVEIAKMASIYSGGVCTISILSAGTADEGWLSPDDNTGAFASSSGTRSIKRFDIDRTMRGKQQARQRLILEMCSDFAPDPGPEPLNTRGWTLQESLLSPRLLTVSSAHRGFSTLRCAKSITRTNGAAVYHTSQSAAYPVNNDRGEAASDSSEPGNALENASKRWYEVVSDYANNRSLTEKTDKLNALSGIVNEFIRLEKLGVVSVGTFVAGLWDKSLLLDLLWMPDYRCQKQGDCRAVNNVYLGPSWSWVSRNHPVAFEASRNAWIDPAADVIGHKTVPQNPRNPNGALRYAELTLLCHAVEVVAADVPDTEIDDRPYTHDENGTVWYLDIAGEEAHGYPYFVGLVVQEVDRKGEKKRNPEVDHGPDGPALYRRVGMFKSNRLANARDARPPERFTII